MSRQAIILASMAAAVVAASAGLEGPAISRKHEEEPPPSFPLTPEPPRQPKERFSKPGPHKQPRKRMGKGRRS